MFGNRLTSLEAKLSLQQAVEGLVIFACPRTVDWYKSVLVKLLRVRVIYFDLNVLFSKNVDNNKFGRYSL